MKTFLVFLFILLGLSGGTEVQAMKKRALIIAIGTYAPETNWPKTSAANDVEVLRYALEEQDFHEEDILILQDQQATKAAIIQAFENHFSDLKKGDFAYFHFSGHGQQLPDRNGDEYDLKDEALATYHAYEKFGKNAYQGAEHLTDDELHLLLDKLRVRLGPLGQVLVTLDACHSGTATRDLEDLGPARGSIHLMAAPEEVKKLRKPSKDFTFLPVKETSGKAALIVFSATSQKGLNYEVIPKGQKRRYGPLSFAFASVFANVDKHTSYEVLFDMVKKMMVDFRNPQIPIAEGNLNHTIGGSPFEKNNEHFKVISQNKSFVQIDGGSFSGLLPGTLISFYPKDTWNPKGAGEIVQGVVHESQIFTSFVKIKSDKKIPLMSKWGYIELINFGSLEINVQLDIDDLNFLEKMEKQINAVSNFKITNGLSQLTIREKQGKDLEIFTANDQGISTKKIIQVDPETKAKSILNKILLPFAQAQYLRELDLKDEFMRVEMEVLPQLKVVDPVSKKVSYKNADDVLVSQNGKPLTFYKGDKIKIRLTNNNEVDVYVALYDIQPDNKINVLIPGKNRTREEYLVKAKHSLVLPHRWTINPPYGTEVFKLVVLNRPVDILQPYTKGAVDILPNPPAKGNHRSADFFNQSIPPNTANIESIIFNIKAKKVEE